MPANSPIADDRRLLTEAVAEFSRRTRFPVAFGGLLDASGSADVTAVVGARTRSLEGLSVAPERGLGGRALSEMRPRMTGDYGSATQITHDYDPFILGEGIGTLISVPVIVDGTARGLLYGGAWGSWGVGGVAAAPAVEVAELFAKRLSAAAATPAAPAPAPAPGMAAAQLEELRATYTDLRLISAEVDDAGIRARLQEIERRLASLSGAGEPSPAAGPEPTVRLSPRETDVIACVALGATNAEIAQQLGLREGTVKAYLGSAMSKLDASTRHAAVVSARRAGILP